MEEKKKFKGINKTIITIAIITCILIVANVFASKTGHGNIFLLIGNLFTNEKDVNENQIANVEEKEAYKDEKEEKLPENELKKYLGAFALLSDQHISAELSETSEWEMCIYIADGLNNKILHKPGQLKKELIDNIIDSFYWGDKGDIVKAVLENESDDGPELLYLYDKATDSYVRTAGYGFPEWRVCLNINDISYNEGVYTIDFVYCCEEPQDGVVSVEDPEHYKATIQLKYNPNSEYSKYKIVSISDPTLITKPTTDANK